MTESNSLIHDDVLVDVSGCADSAIPVWLGRRGVQLVLILLLTAAVCVPSMLTRDLWNPDEPRYMEVSREMVALGDYVIPHLSGQVYSEKPPVWFWGAAALWRLGLGYNSGRVLTMLAVTVTLLLTWQFTRGQAGSRAGGLAALVMLTTVFMVDMAKLGVLDPLLMLLATGAMVSGYRAFRAEGRRQWGLWCAAYAFMGLATITKGPVGLIVPGLVLLSYGIIDRKRLHGGGWAHLLGLGVCIAVICAWLVPACVIGGDDYTRTILFKQNFGRAVSSYSHRNPFYFYLTVAPWRLFPWVLLLVPAVVSAWRLWRRDGDGLALFALLWLFVPLVFFSLMSGKRDRYILPITPAVGILCGRYLVLKCREGVRFPRADRWLLSIGLGTVGLTAGFLGAAVFAVRFLPALQSMATEAADGEASQFLNALTPWHAIVTASLGLCALVVFVAAIGRKWQPVPLALGTVAAVILLSLAIDLSVTPGFNAIKSGRDFGLRVRELSGGGHVRVYLYKSEYSGVYNLYSGIVHMPILRDRERLAEVLATEDALVIGNEGRFRNALAAHELERVTLYAERVGHRKMVVLSGLDRD